MMVQLLIAVLGFATVASGFFQQGGYGSGGNVVHSNTQQKDNCPQQVDFAAELQLSTDSTGYPTTGLNEELVARPDLAACLSREIVLPTDPVVPDDPALQNAQDTCPHMSFMLFSYFNHNAKCWIIPGVQEMVNFTACAYPNGDRKCWGCNDFFSGWGNEPRCVHQYKYFSVWAYCEGLPLNNRIVRERVILPYACNCQKIRCYSTSFFWKK